MEKERAWPAYGVSRSAPASDLQFRGRTKHSTRLGGKANFLGANLGCGKMQFRLPDTLRALAHGRAS